MEKNKALTEALQTLATENHELKQSLSKRRKSSNLSTLNEDDFYDAVSGQRPLGGSNQSMCDYYKRDTLHQCSMSCWLGEIENTIVMFYCSKTCLQSNGFRNEAGHVTFCRFLVVNCILKELNILGFFSIILLKNSVYRVQYTVYISVQSYLADFPFLLDLV